MSVPTALIKAGWCRLFYIKKAAETSAYMQVITENSGRSVRYEVQSIFGVLVISGIQLKIG